MANEIMRLDRGDLNAFSWALPSPVATDPPYFYLVPKTFVFVTHRLDYL